MLLFLTLKQQTWRIFVWLSSLDDERENRGIWNGRLLQRFEDSQISRWKQNIGLKKVDFCWGKWKSVQFLLISQMVPWIGKCQEEQHQRHQRNVESQSEENQGGFFSDAWMSWMTETFSSDLSEHNCQVFYRFSMVFLILLMEEIWLTR